MACSPNSLTITNANIGMLTLAPQQYSADHVTVEIRELVKELHHLRARVQWLEGALNSEAPKPWIPEAGRIPSDIEATYQYPQVNLCWNK